MVLTAVFYFFSFFSNILSSMARRAELPYSRKSLNRIVRRRVLEALALIHSAAKYSAASVALVVPRFVNKEVEYFPCLSPFIVQRADGLGQNLYVF
ncbi:hypothetical protein C8Q74DRAFT_1373661 [Fomes fomentarius]|nr:hypothetical protein C8Q74DRAFT_1373661 [Fomes fomentarius]